MCRRINTNKIAYVSLVMLLALGLKASIPKKEFMANDHFIFEINHRDKYATAIELTEAGKEQEVLVVPPSIRGFPVRYIGKPKRFFQPLDINALKLTDKQIKIYLPYSLRGQMWLASVRTVEAILALANLDDFDKVLTINSFPEIKLHYLNGKNKLNTFYMYNFESSLNEGYYFMDYINGSNPYVIPSDPVRNGYTFAGWYYQKECATLWNNEVPKSESESLTLFAKWI